ncbi:MAG TPA: HD-GYP domain-containing protein [Tepidisphaeraceae bacterium]|jgi:HD-GYP domain-containing protein (c-di-GMP phosphodiesterase class II)|nr:HD-GYP domain-containing protein [Tepidisphaeraceae bacterium]
MAPQFQTSPRLAADAFVLPTGVLETVAGRLRAGSVLLTVLNVEGVSPAFSDQAASPFFRHYAQPLLERLHKLDPAFVERIQAAQPGSPALITEALPGLLVAALPRVERRQVHGLLLIAAKHRDFNGSSEEVIRACGQLQVDATYIASLADELPGYSTASVQMQTELLASILRDQLRLAGVEQELNSLSSQLANTYEELTLIYQISSGMRVNRRAADFFRQACLDVLDVLSVRAMGVTLDHPGLHDRTPVLYGNHSVPSDTVERLAPQLMDTLRERNGILLINDVAGDPRFAWLAPYAKQLIAVPLQRQDEMLGCLFGLDKTEGDFDSVDAKLLNSISNEAAIYLENAMLFEDVHDLMMGLLHSLTSAVDAKDAYTCGHSERVALISRALAQRAGLSDQQVQRIYMAGLLHDVGKIGVPEAVLQKAGKLTDEEFDLIKKHPEIGGRILRDVKQVQDIIPGVLYHHERYDGRGYPAKLVGEAIPLMGRIICLADCFDAMTSSRTYRKALPIETALEEIRRNAGTQFDPQLAEAFLSIGVDRLRAILNDHQSRSLPPIMVSATHVPAVAPVAEASNHVG